MTTKTTLAAVLLATSIFIALPAMAADYDTSVYDSSQSAEGGYGDGGADDYNNNMYGNQTDSGSMYGDSTAGDIYSFVDSADTGNSEMQNRKAAQQKAYLDRIQERARIKQANQDERQKQLFDADAKMREHLSGLEKLGISTTPPTSAGIDSSSDDAADTDETSAEDEKPAVSRPDRRAVRNQVMQQFLGR